MRSLLAIIALLFCGQLAAKPVIEKLAGISIGKPLDPEIKRRAVQADRRNTLPNMLQLQSLPDYGKIAGCKVKLFTVFIDGGNVASIEIRFDAAKGNRARVFEWIKNEIGLDPAEFENGRLNYSEQMSNGYNKHVSLGSYVVGMEDREYTITMGWQKVR